MAGSVTGTVSGVRWVQLGGAPALRGTLTLASDLDDNDAVSALNLALSAYLPSGKNSSNTTIYATPVFVAMTPSTESLATATAVDLQWDPASDSAANGTVRIEVAHHGSTDDTADGMVIEFLMFFEGTSVGVNSGFQTVS